MRGAANFLLKQDVKVAFGQVDIDKNPKLKALGAISKIPTMFIIA